MDLDNFCVDSAESRELCKIRVLPCALFCGLSRIGCFNVLLLWAIYQYTYARLMSCLMYFLGNFQTTTTLWCGGVRLAFYLIRYIIKNNRVPICIDNFENRSQRSKGREFKRPDYFSQHFQHTLSKSRKRNAQNSIFFRIFVFVFRLFIVYIEKTPAFSTTLRDNKWQIICVFVHCHRRCMCEQKIKGPPVHILLFIMTFFFTASTERIKSSRIGVRNTLIFVLLVRQFEQ